LFKRSPLSGDLSRQMAGSSAKPSSARLLQRLSPVDYREALPAEPSALLDNPQEKGAATTEH
ncbi:MAG: hypothetical protein AAFZ17_12760, partial [Cyanobacteria bacterium J06650_10]